MSQDDFSQMKVLIVEDEEQILEFLKDVLEGLGFPVFTAPNGVRAFEIMKAEKISLVLSDINMPEISGLQLLTKARRQNLGAPFIFLTGNCSADVIIEAVRLGASDFLLKPFEVLALEKVVQRVAAIGLRMEQIDDMLRSLGQDVAPKTHAHINDLRRQINVLRTMV